MASLWRPSARAEQLRPSRGPPTAACSAFFTCPANDCRRLRKQGRGRCRCCDEWWMFSRKAFGANRKQPLERWEKLHGSFGETFRSIALNLSVTLSVRLARNIPSATRPHALTPASPSLLLASIDVDVDAYAQPAAGDQQNIASSPKRPLWNLSTGQARAEKITPRRVL